MIEALLDGKLFGKPMLRQGNEGKAFVTAKLRTAVGNGEILFASLIAFDEHARAALLGLDDGDRISAVGTLTPKVWTSHDGEARPALDVLAHQALSTYHATRKRRAVRGEE